MDKIVAIHQPNFFPWLGYFNKIARADIFVFLDHVQFPKTGGVWSNRVKLVISGEDRWVTAAIDRNYNGTRKINEMRFVSSNPWREKMLKTLAVNYKKHPFYDETMELIQPLILNQEQSISKYNIQAIKKIVSAISLKQQRFVCSSALSFTSNSNELLCEITTSLGGKTYLCGGGADGYQDESVFDRFGINLKYQNFQHPTYDQFKCDKFLAGVSVIDAAMNVGWTGVKNLLGAKRNE